MGIPDSAVKGAKIGACAGASAWFGYLLGLDPSVLFKFITETATNQIAQAGFFFAAAAWIHSGRVKKEIARNFGAMTDAINNVANALSSDLKNHKEILDNHEKRLETLEAKKSQP